MEKEMTTETEVMQGTVEEAVQEEKKPYTLRALNSKDIFPMMKIISCIKISKFSDCFSSDEAKRLIEKSMQNQNRANIPESVLNSAKILIMIPEYKDKNSGLQNCKVL